MQVFQRAQRRVAQSLLLMLSLLVVPTIQAQAPVVSERTAEVYFDTETAVVQVGGESSINLVLNTNGQEIDALQVGWELSGVRVTDVRLELATSIPFTVFNEEVSAEAGSVYFLPTNPQSPFSSTSPTVLAKLYFIPQESGALTFQYNRENTLIAAHDTSENIANVHAGSLLAVDSVLQDGAGEALPESAVNIQADETFVDDAASLRGGANPPVVSPVYPLLAGTLLVVLVALLVLFLWRRRSVGASLPPPASATPPSAVGVQVVPAQTPQPVAAAPGIPEVMPPAVPPGPLSTELPQLEITPPPASGPKNF